MNDKKYKLSSEDIVFKRSGIWKFICQFGILALLCLLSFLVAKYIVNIGIDRNDKPVDTSERLL